jgi:hypothetical protein
VDATVPIEEIADRITRVHDRDRLEAWEWADWASAGDYKINWLPILDRGSGSKLSPFGAFVMAVTG